MSWEADKLPCHCVCPVPEITIEYASVTGVAGLVDSGDPGSEFKGGDELIDGDFPDWGEGLVVEADGTVTTTAAAGSSSLTYDEYQLAEHGTACTVATKVKARVKFTGNGASMKLRTRDWLIAGASTIFRSGALTGFDFGIVPGPPGDGASRDFPPLAGSVENAMTFTASGAVGEEVIIAEIELALPPAPGFLSDEAEAEALEDILVDYPNANGPVVQDAFQQVVTTVRSLKGPALPLIVENAITADGLQLAKVGFRAYTQPATEKPAIYLRETMSGDFEGEQSYTLTGSGTEEPSADFDSSIPEEALPLASGPFSSTFRPAVRGDTSTTRTVKVANSDLFLEGPGRTTVQLELADEYTTDTLRDRVQAYVEAQIEDGGGSSNLEAADVLSPDETFYYYARVDSWQVTGFSSFSFADGTSPATVTVRWKKRVRDWLTGGVTVTDESEAVGVTKPAFGAAEIDSAEHSLTAEEGTSVTLYDFTTDPVDEAETPLALEWDD